MKACARAALLLLFTPGGWTEDPPLSGRQRIEDLVAAVKAGEPAERIRELGQGVLQATSPSGGLASTLRDPSISATVGVSGSVERGLLAVGGGLEPGKGKIFLKTAVASVEVGCDPDNRTVGITFNVGHSASWAGGQKVVSLDLTYPDNQTYLAATGFDGKSVPGTSAVLAAIDDVLQRAGPDTRAETPEGAARAARDALVNNLVPEMFQKGTEFTTFTFGEGERISIPAANGSISVLEMRKTRMRADGSFPVEFTEQSAEIGLSKKGVVVEAEASVSLTVSSDPDAQKNPYQLELARRLEAAGGDPAEALRAYARERLLPIYEGSKIAASLAMLRDRAAEPIDEINRLFILDDPAVGGVKIHFNPELLRATYPPARAADLLRGLAEAGTDGGSAVVRSEPERFRVKLVSVADAAKSGRLGLSRVRGFVIRKGEFLLAGDAAEPGMPAEWLTAFLRTIWRQGRFPAVSLDPDAADFSGAQTAKVYGMPPDLVDCDAVRLMLDADYAMKRIDLGEDDVGLKGFRTTIGIVRDLPPNEEWASRMWLMPSDPWIGDIVEASGGGGQCVWFRSGVKVRSERVQLAFGELRGTGEIDSISDAAAQSFTAYYDEIAARRPVFAELAGLFDLAKLCAILRVRQVAHPALDAMAGRPVPRVPVPATFQGIGPKQVEGTRFTLSGGATTRTRPIDTRRWEMTGLGTLLEGASGAEVTVENSPVTRFDGGMGSIASAEILANASIHCLSEGRLEEAFGTAEQALLADPTHPTCRYAHALAAAATGRMDVAVRDAESLFDEDPRFRAFAAVLLACNGDEAGALRYADAAERELGDDPAALAWTSRARLFAGDFAGSEAAAIRLAALLPDSPVTYDLHSELDIAWALGPKAARARVKEARAVPLDVSEALAAAAAEMKRVRYEAAARQFQVVHARAEGRGISAFHIRERCLMGMAMAWRADARMREEFGREGAEQCRAAAYGAARELTDLHPDWPSAALLLSWLDPDPSLIARFEAGAADGAEDPLLPEFRALVGTDRIVPYGLLTYWWQMPDEKAPEALEVLEKLIACVGDTPEARLLAAVGEASRLDDRRAVRVLRAALAAWPGQGPRDVVAISILTRVARQILAHDVEVKPGGAVEAREEDPKAIFDDACLALRHTGGEASSWELVTMLAAVRVQAVIALVLADSQMIESDPRVRLLMREAANGKYDAAEADRVVAEVAAERRAETESAAGPFAAALAAAFHPELESRRRLVAQAGAALQGQREGEKERRRLQALEEEMNALKAPRDAGAFAHAAERAATATDARTMRLLDDILTQYLPPELAETGKEMRRAVTAASARLKPPRAPARAPRDWRAWEGR